MSSSGSAKKIIVKSLIAQVAFSMVCVPFTSNVLHAQSTTCTSGSSDCLDIYQGTINAIIAANYQPASGSTNQSIGGTWQINQLYGGVLDGGTASVTVPSGYGTPTNSVLASTFVYNCPGNVLDYTGSVTVSTTISDTIDITSDTQVTNTSSTFNNGSAGVSISFTEGNTNEAGFQSTQSGNLNYSWGQTFTNTTQTGVTGSTDNGTSSTLTYTSNFSVPSGYGQYVQIADEVVTVPSSNWSSQVVLASPGSYPITSQVYYETFASSGPTPQTVSSISGNGIPANIWYAPSTWTSNDANVLASPNGIYAFIPNWTADLVGFAWTGIGNAEITYYEGAWYGTEGEGMNLYLANSCTDGCAGTFYATNSAGNKVSWDSNTSPSFIAMQNDGNLVGYLGTPESATAIWTSNTTGNAANPQERFYITQPSTLLQSSNGLAFTATGTYASTNYNTSASMGPTTPALLTSDQLTQYCATSKSQGHTSIPQETQTYADGLELFGKNKNLLKTYFDGGYAGGMMAVDYQGDARREAQRFEDSRRYSPGNQASPDSLSNPRLERGYDFRNSDGQRSRYQGKPLGKLRKLRGNFVLEKDQYYVAKLPGLRVTKVEIKSENHTNYNGFDGLKTLDDSSFAPGTKIIKLEKGFEKKFSVKPRNRS